MKTVRGSSASGARVISSGSPGSDPGSCAARSSSGMVAMASWPRFTHTTLPSYSVTSKKYARRRMSIALRTVICDATTKPLTSCVRSLVSYCPELSPARSSRSATTLDSSTLAGGGMIE